MNIKEDIKEELKKAESKFPEYHSPHEGYAIIVEALDELWDEVRKHDHNEIKMYHEAIQVAVTSIIFCKMIQRMYKGVIELG